MKLAPMVNKLLLLAIPLATFSGCTYMKSGRILTNVNGYEVGKESDGTCYVEDWSWPVEDYHTRFTDQAFSDNDVSYMVGLMERCEEGEFDPVTPEEPIMDRF